MPDDALHTTPRDLSPEELRALILEAKIPPAKLLGKLTEGEQKTFIQLANTDDEIMQALGGVLGAPIAPIGAAGAGLSQLAKGPGVLKRLSGLAERFTEAGKATIAKVPMPPSALPAAKSTISNLSRVDTSALPSIEGAGGVSVEGPGLLTTLLGVLGLGGATSGAEAPNLQKRKAY